MKIFLTGATGFIGSKLALYLAAKNHQINALVRDLQSENLPVHENIIPFKGDVGDPDSIKKAIEGCEYVIHMAAFTDIRYRHIDRFYQVNVNGTSNVLSAAMEAQVKKFIFTSSISVFGDALSGVPITEKQPRLNAYHNDYELTKVMAEELVKEYCRKGLNCTILNVGRVYGPGFSTYSNGINKLFEIIEKYKCMISPDKLNTKASYVYIDDVIAAHELGLKFEGSGEKFIIGGENASYERLFHLIFKISGTEKKVFKIDYEFLKILGKIHSFFSRSGDYQSSLSPEILDFLFTERAASSQKAQKLLGYRYTGLEEGLQKTSEFIKNIRHETTLLHADNRS